jgi:alkanesulfonate monooxygenase SsuD/methylene tetrahydromethanopterin reductase-like flavin-dependent oxidoreductase (luciferase family)
MIAKQAASLDALSNGRFELGLGAGAFWEAIGAMGGPVRSGGKALRALEEAIRIIRAFWSGERTLTFDGEHYSVRGQSGLDRRLPGGDARRSRDRARGRRRRLLGLQGREDGRRGAARGKIAIGTT